MSITKEEWRNMPDDVLHGFSRPGSNPWEMSHRKERLLKLQEKNHLKINRLPKNKNLKWAQDRIFVLSFPDWIVEQVPLAETPMQHRELVTNQGDKPIARYIAGKEWIHLRSLHQSTGEALAISFLVGDHRDGVCNFTLVRRQGVGMLNRIMEVADGQTIFILPDVKSFTVKASTMTQLRDSKLRVPSRKTATSIPSRL